LVVFVIALLRSRSDAEDARFLRPGLLAFIVCALYDHITGIVGHSYRDLEPFGFLLLIVCLGIVAGRRALAQEQQLGLIQQELQIAQRIQLSILPTTLPNPECFRIAARYLPMTSVAGDFYDFIIPDDRHAGILVADVSGHGVPAALIASMVKLATAAQVSNAARPAELLHGMNLSLCGNTQSQFVTAAYVHLDAVSDMLQYAAAAHPAMFVLRNREVIRITENGLMLGAFSSATYTEISYPLLPGDRLLLYTDGILEATNMNEEEFGGDRLADLLKETGGMDHMKTADFIVKRIQQWSRSQEDDLTVLICDYKHGYGESAACV
jgi:sigma-B regulation protein RsbU (phosphoserine phosphatase)